MFSSKQSWTFCWWIIICSLVLHGCGQSVQHTYPAIESLTIADVSIPPTWDRVRLEVGGAASEFLEPSVENVYLASDNLHDSSRFAQSLRRMRSSEAAAPFFDTLSKQAQGNGYAVTTSLIAEGQFDQRAIRKQGRRYLILTRYGPYISELYFFDEHQHYQALLRELLQQEEMQLHSFAGE